MQKLKSTIIFTGIAFCLNVSAQFTPADAISLSKSIQSETFFSHLGFLASDSLEGRGIGTRGFDKAAGYVVANIENLGLKPAGAAGSYFQPIAFESRTINKESVKLSFNLADKSATGSYGEDFTILPNLKPLYVNNVDPVVFVGFGMEIPELGINDFEGVDVRGKIVMIAFGAPDHFDKKKYKKQLDPFEKIRILEKKGASGVIFFTKTGMLQKLLFKAIHNFFSQPYIDYQDADLSNPMLSGKAQLLIFSKKEFIDKTFVLNGISLKKTLKSMDNGTFKPFALNSGFTAGYTASAKPLMSKNIVAVLPGTDPELKSEYLVLSAHLDHLGIGKAVKGDSIYNGAWDNASGSATLLSIAETYSKIPEAPKRSVVFCWVTGEEKGLLGSNYFAQKPGLGDGKIVADMSLDMPGGIFVAKDIIPMGYKMSNLSEAVDFAADAMNFAKDTTSAEEDKYFERSDHFSFVKAGIPALFIFSGMTAADPKINGKKAMSTWEKKLYHSPFDDMNQPFSKEALLQGIQVNFLISWFIANEIDQVKWKTGSKQYKDYIQK